MRCHTVRAGVLVCALVSAVLSVDPAAAQPPPTADLIAVLTGPQSADRTDLRYQVKGTDLGVLWADDRGQVRVAFGDTFGLGWSGPGSRNIPVLDQWRSNTLAFSTDTTLADGMRLDRFVTGLLPLQAREIIPSKKVDHDELTTIPTGGVHVDGRDYLAFMSVRHFEPVGGRWTTNHAGVAYSDDGGTTWIDVPEARRGNTPAFDDPFQMIAYARNDGFVYAFGTPNGRFGDVRVARVPEHAVLDLGVYRYWTAAGWSPSPEQAVPVVGGPVGELSVHYDEGLRRWLMMYLDESRHEIVLRTAPAPTGPWSPETAVAGAAQFGQLYAPFIHPTSRDGDVYFTMSQYAPYHVVLMQVRLGG